MFTFVGYEVIQIQKTCNDGQCRAGTDRSNICSLADEQYDKIKEYDMFERLSYSVVDDNDEEFADGTVGDLGNDCPDNIQMSDHGSPEYYDFGNKPGVTASYIARFDIETIQALCTTRRIDSQRLLEYCNMKKLDDAGITYCTVRVEVKAAGLWNFLCTRNDNFSNRSQKSSLLLSDSASENYAINSRGYSSFDSSQAGNAQIVIQSGMIDDSDTLLVTVYIWKNTDEESTIVEITSYDGGVFSSDYIAVTNLDWKMLVG